MSIEGLLNIKKAISNLSSQGVREQSERPLHIALYAANAQRYAKIENFLLYGLSAARRRQSIQVLARGPMPAHALQYDLAIYDESVLAPARALVFEEFHPDRFVRQALDQRLDLGVALARDFSAFRKPFIDRVISKTARDNTLFSLATALPDIIPSLIELPWSLAEFASDSAFLTMNQIHMAFLIAGASDRPVGYSDQKSEIGAVIAGAFGWRAIARELIGKIPFGGGLIPKAAIAYAATKVVGLSLDRYYGIGYHFTRQEREVVYADALRQGKKVAGHLLKYIRPQIAQRLEQVPANRTAAGPIIESHAERLR
ncbi:MAG: hypothetical protein WA324_11985 [Bryobacteraceae bacterium]